MNHSRNHRQSPLAPFPGQPTARLHHRVPEVPRTQPLRFPVTPTGKGFMQASLNVSYAGEKVS